MYNLAAVKKKPKRGNCGYSSNHRGIGRQTRSHQQRHRSTPEPRRKACSSESHERQEEASISSGPQENFRRNEEEVGPEKESIVSIPVIFALHLAGWPDWDATSGTPAPELAKLTHKIDSQAFKQYLHKSNSKYT